MTRACFGVVLASVLLAGCPKSRDDGGGGAVPIESLPRELAQAYCDLIFRCDIGGDDVAFLELVFDDASSCASTFEGSVFGSGKIDALMRAVAEGTVEYDADAAGTCAASIGADCSATVSGTTIGDEAACDMVFTGTVPEGGECWINEECQGDLGCEFTGDACPGTCTASGGFPCGGTEACPADQECFFPESGTERCVTEVMEADGGLGDECGLVEETPIQVTRRACRAGLWCTGDSRTLGTCREPIAAGEACSSSGDVCVYGHICVGGSCQQVTIVDTAGEPCNEGELLVCNPFERLQCVGGTCLVFTDGAAGSDCETGDFGEATCNEGLVCYDDTETCGAPLAAGDACARNAECASGSCDFSSGTCRERYCDN